MTKRYRVATFWHNDLGKSGMATSYLRVYNPSWEGCIIYDVEAKTGREAVRIATAMRAQKERGAAPDGAAKAE